MKSSTLHAIMRLTARDRLLIASSQGAPTDGSPDKQGLYVLEDAQREGT